MEQTTRPRSADRSRFSTGGWRVLDPHAPDAGMLARLRGLDSAVTMRVGRPFRLAEAIALQARMRALIAHGPAAVVLDMDGLVPLDEMSVLMLPAVAHEAAAEGTAVLLANPSRPLHDRLVQLGVRDLTLVDRRAPTPTDDEDDQTGGHDEALPCSPCPFCGALRRDRVPVPGGARDPASVVAARQLAQGRPRPSRADQGSQRVPACRRPCEEDGAAQAADRRDRTRS